MIDLIRQAMAAKPPEGQAGEQQTITPADVAEVSASDILGANGIINCTICHKEVDKGQPAHPSDKRHFVCDGCQTAHNHRELARLNPTVEIKL